MRLKLIYFEMIIEQHIIQPYYILATYIKCRRNIVCTQTYKCSEWENVYLRRMLQFK
jgi:hypothetical protein